MTVGQVQQTEIKSLTEELQNNWTPIDFMVTEIYIISRKSDNEKMKIVETIKFGSD